jgi:hypothetical protein
LDERAQKRLSVPSQGYRSEESTDIRSWSEEELQHQIRRRGGFREKIVMLIRWTGEDITRRDISGAIHLGPGLFGCCKARVGKVLGLPKS